MATKYWIVNTSQLSSLDYTQLAEKNEEETRKSVNGLKAIVESSQTPTGLSDDDSLTHAEAIAAMETTEWYQPDPNDEVGLD